jgi:hypothetical protein
MTQLGGRENQHYVPKMLLRNFAIGKSVTRGKEQVHVLDKSNSRAFTANIRNVAAAFEFYEAEIAGQVVNAESILSELEGHASAALQEVLAADSVTCLDAEKRMWLSIFCSVQFVRTQATRDRIVAMNAGQEAHIIRMGYDPAEVEGFERLSENDVKSTAIQWIASAINEYPKYFTSKRWFLMKAKGDFDFFIGDHRVVLHNDREFGPWGNLGLAVPGVQIYMPLSPRRVLAIWCPTIFDEIEKGHHEHDALQAQVGRNRSERRAAKARAGADFRPLERQARIGRKSIEVAKGGGCLLCNDDNVTMLNSLQVMNSSRFLMSRSGNFSLAERMFGDNAAFRSRTGDGLRVD